MAVLPGMTETRMKDELDFPVRSEDLLQPDDVATAVLSAWCSPAAPRSRKFYLCLPAVHSALPIEPLYGFVFVPTKGREQPHHANWLRLGSDGAKLGALSTYSRIGSRSWGSISVEQTPIPIFSRL